MAFYDSVKSLSLPGLALHPHTCSDSLLVQIAGILAITLLWTEAMWVELGLGFATCSVSILLSLPLASPRCPSKENKSEVSSMHRAERENRGGEM